MSPLEIFLIVALASAADPLPALVLLWPAALHRQWWPLVLWSIARTALTPLLAPEMDGLRLAAVFAGSLGYMTALWAAATWFRSATWKRPA
jgi:hypothetical protein